MIGIPAISVTLTFKDFTFGDRNRTLHRKRYIDNLRADIWKNHERNP
jgi:hypothetical protein